MIKYWQEVFGASTLLRDFANEGPREGQTLMVADEIDEANKNDEKWSWWIGEEWVMKGTHDSLTWERWERLISSILSGRRDGNVYEMRN